MRTRRRCGAVVAVLCIARAAAAQQSSPPAAATARLPSSPAPSVGAVPAPPSSDDGPAEPPAPREAPPPLAAEPSMPAPGGTDPYAEPVPVWMTGADGETATIAIYPDWATPGSVPPIAHCTLPCGFQMQRGRYRIDVAETPNTLGGSRPIAIDGPARLVITPRDRAKRTAGLALGIGGMAAVIGGLALLAEGVSTRYRCDTDGFCDRTSTFDPEAGAGLALFLVGAAVTPIGWVMFGKSFRPAIDVEHPGLGAALRARVGVVPLRGGAGLGGSFVF